MEIVQWNPINKKQNGLEQSKKWKKSPDISSIGKLQIELLRTQ